MTLEIIIWMTLLGACRTYRDVERAESIFQRAVKDYPQHSSLYILMINTYVLAGRPTDADRISEEMKRMGIKKPPGTSWIEINRTVHTFRVSEREHAEMELILQSLKILDEKMRESGYYSPNTNYITNRLLTTKVQKEQHHPTSM